MKKTIAILLILVIGMVGVFAAVTAFTNNTEQTLNLTTTVAVANAFMITSESKSGENFYTVFGTGVTDEVTTYRTIAADGSTIDPTYLTIGTNATNGFTLYLASAPALAAANITSKIHYVLTITGVDQGDIVTWDTSEDEDAILLVTAKATAGGATVLSKEITVEIDEESFYNAVATDSAGEFIAYSANVVFNVSGT